MTPALVGRCVNCGAERGGPFCATCGQAARDERLTLGHVARQVAAELSPVDRGIVYTALAVAGRPGRMAREYVDGRTVRYVGPVKYFLLLVGLAQILALRGGLLRDMVAGLLEGWYAAEQPVAPGQVQAAMLGFLSRYFVSVCAVGVPIFAAWTRLLFRSSRLNYAEHLVLALYTGAQHLAAFTLVAWLGQANGIPKLDTAYTFVALGYQVWALRQFTAASVGGATWRTLVAAVLTPLCGAALLGIIYAIAGRQL